MKFLYEVIINALLFYFFLNFFNGINIAGSNNNILINIGSGLLFGLLIASIPSILKFFKVPVNNGATFLMALIVIFIFMFILQQGIFGLGSIGQTTINLRPIVTSGALKFNPVQTMVLATVLISLSVLGLKSLQKSGGK